MMDKAEILKKLDEIRKKDFQESLFYSWNDIPLEIQDDFITWCIHYMQVSHEGCFNGWAGGWQKYHDRYLLWLKGKFTNPIIERENDAKRRN